MIYSIGYQRLSLPQFIKVLRALKISEVVDCRQKPVSRVPGFSRSKLEDALAGVCEYTLAGHHLGGRGKVRSSGLAYVRELDKRGRNAMLLCMEEAPGECHRHHDIAVKLLPAIDVTHVVVDELVLASELQRAIDEDDDYMCEEFAIPA